MTKITANNIQLDTLTAVTTPKISAIGYGGDDLATAVGGGQTVTLSGSGFVSGCQILIGTVYASVVTFVSSTVITFVAPARTAGTYALYVINPDGGTGISIPGVSYSNAPVFGIAAGSLGTEFETNSFSTTIGASSDSVVTYSVHSGTLPPGIALNANTGVVSGTIGSIANPTTYTFTVRATDLELQDVDRNFSITVNPDVVTFNTPASTATYANVTGNVFSLTLNATSTMGKTVSYSANVLPGGLSLTGSVISGTFNTAVSTTSLVTATAAVTNKTATRLFNWTVTVPPPTGATAFWYAGGGNTSSVFRILFASDTQAANQRGSLSSTTGETGGVGNDTNGWFAGISRTNSSIQRITFASDTGTGITRGAMSEARMSMAGTGNMTNGWFAGGLGPTFLTGTIDRIAYATDTTNAVFRASISQKRAPSGTTDGNPYGSTYGWYSGGFISGSEPLSSVDRITFASDTSMSVRGSLAYNVMLWQASTSTTDHGRIAGGFGQSNVIRIVYANDTITAGIRGPLSIAKYGMNTGGGNSSYGWIPGGSSGSNVDRIDYAADTTTATVRGTMTASNYGGGVSGYV